MHHLLAWVAISLSYGPLYADDVSPAVQRLVAMRAAQQLEVAGDAAAALATLVPFTQGDDPLAIAIQFHAIRLRLILGETGHPALAGFLSRPPSAIRWGITRRAEADTLQLLARRQAHAGALATARAISVRAAVEYPRWVEPPVDLDRDQRRARAHNLIRDMDYAGALEELEALLRGAGDDAEVRELRRAIGHLIGDKMRGDYARVRDIYAEIVAAPDATIDDYFYLAYATGKLDSRAAAAVYTQIATRFPEHEDADKARFFVAWNAFDREELATAVDAFDAFLRLRPESGFRFAARWYRGLSHFRRGSYEDALKDFEFTARFSRHRDKGRYWSARCLRHLGRHRRANELLVTVAERRPFSYYGMLARSLLPLGARPPIFDGIRRQAHPVVSEAKAEAALARLSPHSRGLVTEAFAAVQMGWPGLADALLEHLERGELGSKRFRDLRPWLQDRLGLAHRLVRSPEARRCRAALAEDPAQARVHECWEKVYPTPYARLIHAVRGELPATVFWSIMRQESFFLPTARSHADALGLMQVIPQVGEPAATALGRPFDPYELYQPETNLTFFALAASERAERFSGYVPLILMSYNATPEVVHEWLRENQELPFDLFVEEIPWSETREYVKHISSNLARYETLLGARADLRERAHLPQPETVVAEAWGEALKTATRVASAATDQKRTSHADTASRWPSISSSASRSPRRTSGPSSH